MAGREYLNFDLELSDDDGGHVARVLDSPAGEATARFELPFTDEGLENFVLKVGRTRSGVRRFGSPQMEMARSFGSSLYEAAMTDEVETTFRRAIDAAGREGRGLRVRLRIAGGGRLQSVPWEYMYSRGLSRFIVLSAETPLVRYVDLPNRPVPLTVDGPLEILLVVSSPTDVEPLDTDREVSLLRDATGDLIEQGLLRIDVLEVATLQSLRSKLRKGNYHVLHFIGHGGFDERADDGLLVFEDANERAHPVSGHDLGMMLHDHNSLRLLVLNACEGSRTSPTDPFAGVAQALVKQGLPAVVGMQFEITDVAAITFAHELYAAVVDGYPIDAATAEARKAIFASGNDVEWGTPVLHMRAADGVIFDTSKMAKRPSDRGGEVAESDQPPTVLPGSRAGTPVPFALPPDADPDRPWIARRPSERAAPEMDDAASTGRPADEQQTRLPDREDASDPEKSMAGEPMAGESEAGEAVTGEAVMGEAGDIGETPGGPVGTPPPGEERAAAASEVARPPDEPAAAPSPIEDESPAAVSGMEVSPASPVDDRGAQRAVAEPPLVEEPAIEGGTREPEVARFPSVAEVEADHLSPFDHLERIPTVRPPDPPARPERRRPSAALIGAGVVFFAAVGLLTSQGNGGEEPGNTTAPSVTVASTTPTSEGGTTTTEDDPAEPQIEPQLVEPGGTLVASPVAEPPDLDGEVFGDWRTDWSALADTAVAGEGAVEGELRVGWDGSALYIGARVEDGQIDAPNAGNPDQLWRGDSVSFEWGTAAAEGGAARAGDLHVMIGPVPAGDEECEMVNAVNVSDGAAIRAGDPDGRIEAVCALTGDGYVVEAAVPWGVLGVDRPEAGNEFLMNLNVSDATEGGDLRVMVSTNPDRHQPDRTTWQTLRLD